MDAEVTLRGVADVAAALFGGEGGVLDVCGENDMGGEWSRSWEGARPVNGAAEFET